MRVNNSLTALLNQSIQNGNLSGGRNNTCIQTSQKRDTFELVDNVDSGYATYSDIYNKVARPTETSVSSTNYRLEVNDGDNYVTIYNSKGEKYGHFYFKDLVTKYDEKTQKEFLISENGTYFYDMLPMSNELNNDLCQLLGVSKLPREELTGYTVCTNQEVGLKYLQKDTDKGRGGTVIIETATDQDRLDNLANEYLKKYPNLISDSLGAEIHACMEVTGIYKRTETGILSIGYDGMSYNDNYDDKKDWAIKYSSDVYDRIIEGLSNMKDLGDIESFKTWESILGNS